MKMCPLTRSAEQTAGAKCSENCEWWLQDRGRCSMSDMAASLAMIAMFMARFIGQEENREEL